MTLHEADERHSVTTKTIGPGSDRKFQKSCWKIVVTRNLLLLRNSNFCEADERQSVTTKQLDPGSDRKFRKLLKKIVVTRNLLLLRNSYFCEADERMSVTTKTFGPGPASHAGGSTAWWHEPPLCFNSSSGIPAFKSKEISFWKQIFQRNRKQSHRTFLFGDLSAPGLYPSKQSTWKNKKLKSQRRTRPRLSDNPFLPIVWDRALFDAHICECRGAASLLPPITST